MAQLREGAGIRTVEDGSRGTTHFVERAYRPDVEAIASGGERPSPRRTGGRGLACAKCGLSLPEHDGRRRVYIAGRGWQEPCKDYQAEQGVHGVVVPGRTAARAMLKETFAYAEKSKRDAEAKKRKPA